MQCAAQINFLYSAVIPLSICAVVLSLVSLAPKFTKLEDLISKKVFHLRHELLVSLITRYPNGFTPTALGIPTRHHDHLKKERSSFLNNAQISV